MSVSIDDIKKLRAKTSAGMGLCKEALSKSDGDMKKAIEYINKRSDVIGRLHNLTGAKIGLCKLALEETGKDFEKSVELIKERGWDEPIEPDCEIGNGVIETYLHGVDQRLVSLVEVGCKTDFVAKNDEFKSFVHELALQVAAMKPKFVSKDSIPKEKIAELTDMFTKEAQAEGKPKNMSPKIVEGKMNKYLSENCLLEQKWFKDESKTMRNLLDESITKMGEPLEVRRILVWEFGK
ncbi:elongation factor Ts [bacterium]|nr:elongation factor Ts [bacterium]